MTLLFMEADPLRVEADNTSFPSYRLTGYYLRHMYNTLQFQVAIFINQKAQFM